MVEIKDNSFLLVRILWLYETEIKNENSLIERILGNSFTQREGLTTKSGD